jgi:hypothetical protein
MEERKKKGRNKISKRPVLNRTEKEVNIIEDSANWSTI